MRITLHYEAMVGTAVTVARGRSGKVEAKSANDWLRDQTAETAIQTAMMGDAGDETLQLVRFFDTEDFDLTMIHQVLIDYHSKLRALFVDGLCLETGLTAVMLKTLRESPMLVNVGGKPKRIGGNEVTDDVITRCLDRMAAWTKLGEEISRSEFPGYELLQALGPFNLATHAQRIQRNVEHVKVSFKRLCSVLKLPEKDALDEYFHYLPMAVEHWKTDPDNFKAWAAALSRRPRGSPHHGDTLHELVKRVGAWGGSTSGVEQTFAKQRRSEGLHRADMSEEHVNIDAYIMSKIASNPFQSDADKDAFIQTARSMWAELFGHARCRPKFRRRDRKQSNPRRGSTRSETQWIKKRRQSVQAGTESGKVVKRACPDTHWAEGHNKELRFQKQKQMVNAVQAFKDGLLLPSEITEDMPISALASDIHAAKKHTERTKKHAKQNLQRAIHTPHVMRGTCVFVEPALAVEDLMRKIVAVGARSTTHRTDANVFIVTDVTNLGQRSSWCLALGGGFACTPAYVTEGPTKGVALAFKPAVKTRRLFCMSDAFIAAHPVLSNIVAAKASQRPLSTWKPLTEDEICARVVGAPACKKAQFLVLMGVGEDAKFAAIKNRFTADTALSDFLQKPDFGASCMNVCGG